MKIVHVTWVDAASLSGWRTQKAAKEFIDGELSPVQTVGIVIHDDDWKLVLLQTHSENQVMGLFEIPRGCITAIKTLGEI